ncbi:Zinc finger CCHC domain-containing protein 24 [Halotydeus destructor]|nr:Zinc finger CCHC domain-containing protein 24 [Halotydeus destructor]
MAAQMLGLTLPAGLKLTPYQGKKRSFGLFRCVPCNRLWASAASWANCGQQCHTCMANVYPHKQWKLKRQAQRPDVQRAHESDLCEKCRQLGTNCSKLRYANKRQPTDVDKTEDRVFASED